MFKILFVLKCKPFWIPTPSLSETLNLQGLVFLWIFIPHVYADLGAPKHIFTHTNCWIAFDIPREQRTRISNQTIFFLLITLAYCISKFFWIIMKLLPYISITLFKLSFNIPFKFYTFFASSFNNLPCI